MFSEHDSTHTQILITHRGACGKVCYGSQRSAKNAIQRLKRNQRHEPYRGHIHPYVCKDCRAWHVGHTLRIDDEDS